MIAWQRRAAQLKDRVLDLSGGPARLQVILILAGILAMSGADLSTVGAVAPLLEHAFSISYAPIGLLVTASQLTGAFAAIPVGLLSDRVVRVRLLWISILLWACAMVAASLSQSYVWLLLSRVGLGAVSATSGPTLVSLAGDYFIPRERARIYGYILAGDLVGQGFGLLAAGNIGALVGWRWAFAVLVLPSLALAFAVNRYLPEPARGGLSRLEPGADHILSAAEVKSRRRRWRRVPKPAPTTDTAIAKAVRSAGARPNPELVLQRDPAHMPYRKAARYVLAVRTNLYLIVASAIGYFFLAGVRSFAVIYFRGTYHLSEGVATLVLAALGIGALLGVLSSGRVADWLVGRRHPSARLLVAAVCYLLAAGLFAPAVLLPVLLASAPLYFLGAAALGGVNPPADAARLDVMHFRLWGRAESVRTFLRTLLEAAAPFIFGVVADALGGRAVSGVSQSRGTSAAGLGPTFVIMLLPVLAAGLLLLFGRRHYPSDVATAQESERRTAARAGAGQGVARAHDSA